MGLCFLSFQSVANAHFLTDLCEKVSSLRKLINNQSKEISPKSVERQLAKSFGLPINFKVLEKIDNVVSTLLHKSSDADMIRLLMLVGKSDEKESLLTKVVSPHTQLTDKVLATVYGVSPDSRTVSIFQLSESPILKVTYVHGYFDGAPPYMYGLPSTYEEGQVYPTENNLGLIYVAHGNHSFSREKPNSIARFYYIQNDGETRFRAETEIQNYLTQGIDGDLIQLLREQKGLRSPYERHKKTDIKWSELDSTYQQWMVDQAGLSYAPFSGSSRIYYLNAPTENSLQILFRPSSENLSNSAVEQEIKSSLTEKNIDVNNIEPIKIRKRHGTVLNYFKATLSKKI